MSGHAANISRQFSQLLDATMGTNNRTLIQAPVDLARFRPAMRQA